MTGQLVDVGGYRLHLNCTGAGSPTVVLESGFALTARQWEQVQPGIAQFARVCSYDHAGIGWSEPGPLPRTSKKMAEELHVLLEHAGIPGPYVLVAHSYGGMSVRMFAALYPGEVAGVVLVDSVHPERYFGRPIPRSEKWRYWFYRMTAPFGIPRFLGRCPIGPPSCKRYVETYQRMRESTAESAAQVVAAGDLGALPLVVIAHDPQAYTSSDKEQERWPREDTWMRRQRDLTRLSSNASLVLARGTSHQVPTEKPQIVIDAVAKIVASARSTSRHLQPYQRE
jgi:pimeloyl-ACP methyl ester carboxylesterase